MIFPAQDKVENIRQKVFGGEGEIRGLHPFAAAARPAGTRFKTIGEMTLPVGASIGFHRHQDDEEIYIIREGRGLYVKNDGTSVPVAPGDVTLTRSGEGHSLANTGDGPLVFTAVIASD
jgi:mannose-6-phosphate isomerase-like protein (cupin superfamily)